MARLIHLVTCAIITIFLVLSSTLPTVSASPLASTKSAPAGTPMTPDPTGGPMSPDPPAGSSRNTSEFKNCNAAGVSCTCTDWTVNEPDWNLTDFYYKASFEVKDPKKKNESVERGYVSFIVRNNALPYAAICTATSSKGKEFFYGEQWYTCDQNGDGEDEGPGLTWFRYNKRKNLVDVNQTWACAESKGLAYKAIGNVTAGIDCTSHKWENPDWNEGETYNMDTTDCLGVLEPINVPWLYLMGT